MRGPSLGADRWASLIAARRRALADEHFALPVVVNAGTAATIDALDDGASAAASSCRACGSCCKRRDKYGCAQE
jgi:hypothetical protein